MITTVTTTTVATMNSAAAGSLVLVVILTLIILLVKKELIRGLNGMRAQRVSKALSIAVLPLFMVFITTMLIRIGDMLR